MASISDPEVAQLLDATSVAVVSSFNADGSVHSTVTWVDRIDGKLAVNSAVGRVWPTNLERDPRITVLVVAKDNPGEYVEVRGTTAGTTDGADAHIDRLAKKYTGLDEYPFRQPGEQRISFLVDEQRVRYLKQG
jgi:PPOX class probable F420-dependent enzyme